MRCKLLCKSTGNYWGKNQENAAKAMAFGIHAPRQRTNLPHSAVINEFAIRSS